MLTKDNEYLSAAGNSLFDANSDYLIREQCIARELAERHERTMKRDIRVLKEKNSELQVQIDTLAKEKAELESLVQKLQKKLENNA